MIRFQGPCLAFPSANSREYFAVLPDLARQVDPENAIKRHVRCYMREVVEIRANEASCFIATGRECKEDNNLADDL